jgi:cell division protease FtsH
LAEDLDLETIARQTPGFSGADLKNLLNEAALLAARRNKKAIGQEEVEEAVERVLAGPERRSRIISPREKKVTAYHEVGHALVAQLLPDVDPVHKISIVARGRAGGYTRVLPPEDRHLWTRSQFRQQIAFALGGYAAEVLVFGEMTTGASNDIEMATTLARRMVMEYGMSEKLGPRAFGRKEELIFLGRDIQEQRNYSEAVAQEIDGEVEGLIQEAHDRASSLLTENKDKLVEIADTLIEVETFDGKAFNSFFEEKPEPSDDVDAQAASTLVDNEDQQPASPSQDSDDSAQKPRTRPYPGMAT